ncbi:hypothetical protein RB195_009249 [Necator americanus]|uniref:Alpha-galactosidase n=1 Tax=Necator americanus TaxID=51031 RepID=A0ABR1CTX3_NECAM
MEAQSGGADYVVEAEQVNDAHSTCWQTQANGNKARSEDGTLVALYNWGPTSVLNLQGPTHDQVSVFPKKSDTNLSIQEKLVSRSEIPVNYALNTIRCWGTQPRKFPPKIRRLRGV